MSLFNYFKRLSLQNNRRYTDDIKKSKANKKKSKSFNIGEPTDTRTIFSVKYDPENNRYDGLPPELENLLKQNGLNYNAETSKNLPQIFEAYKQSLKQPSEFHI
jgi:hypothetical protein